MPARRTREGDGGLYLGLNSGTSADRIDACVVRLPDGGTYPLRVRVLSHSTAPIPPPLRRLILRAPDGITVRQLCALDSALGERFALAARQALKDAGVRSERVRAAGLHGQTICHLPAAKSVSSTMQIGLPERVALAARVPVVSAFRAADTAAGGEGAPLSPVLDHALFAGDGGGLVLNLGGIANMTAVPENARRDQVFGSDVGPGNMLLDGIMRLVTGGRRHQDSGGRMALKGSVEPELLAAARRALVSIRGRARSLGREQLGEPFLAHYLMLGGRRGLATVDLLATAAALTAECAERAFLKLGPRGSKCGRNLWICGGGVHNRAVMGELAARFGPHGIRVRPLEHGGVGPENRECVLFAFLAREFVAGRPGNLPSVTGAAREVVLGRWTPRPHESR